MALAQRLYEGLELGAEGAVGLITYMRTDSTRLSDDAVTEAREIHRASASARSTCPTSRSSTRPRSRRRTRTRPSVPPRLQYDPETVKRLLTEAAAGNQEKLRDVEDHVRLYQLIWNRFVACQMKPAVYDQTGVDIAAGALRSARQRAGA